MKRISIVGTTGSGKSTLAKQVAQKLAFPCIELDAINWQRPAWEPLAEAELLGQVAEAVQEEWWVIEGGYSAVRPLIWARADTVIWLDYPFPLIFSRLIHRTARRVISRERLWGGNHETLARTLSRDSILLWCMKTYRRRRWQFPQLLAQAEHRHLRVLHFQSPRETETWLKGLVRVPAQVISDPKC